MTPDYEREGVRMWSFGVDQFDIDCSLHWALLLNRYIRERTRQDDQPDAALDSLPSRAARGQRPLFKGEKA